MNALGLSSMFTFSLRQLAQTQQERDQSAERLITGSMVNRASDDPSAIATIAQHETEIYSINKRLDAFAQTEAFLGAKEGGLSVVSELLVDLESLVVNAASTGGQGEGELETLQGQASSIISAIDTIARTTTFKGQSVLSEYTSDFMDEDLSSIAQLMLEDPEKAQEVAAAARDKISTTRAVLGNELNEIDSQREVAMSKLENLSASLSDIQDTDYAKETAELIRAQILESATYRAIEISRESAKQVLGLLESAIQPNANR